MAGEVPVYSPDARLLFHAAPGWVEENAGHLRIVRTRRAKAIARAYLRSDDGELIQWLERTGRRSNYGAGFLQHLDGRVCWALKGTPGSR
jgi:hypothetical protein